MSQTWPQLPAIPNASEPVVDISGRVSKSWYLYFLALDRIVRAVPAIGLNSLADIDEASPANGDVLTFDSGDGKWKGA
jgi:hypothetical protein